MGFVEHLEDELIAGRDRHRRDAAGNQRGGTIDMGQLQGEILAEGLALRDGPLEQHQQVVGRGQQFFESLASGLPRAETAEQLRRRIHVQHAPMRIEDDDGRRQFFEQVGGR